MRDPLNENLPDFATDKPAVLSGGQMASSLNPPLRLSSRHTLTHFGLRSMIECGQAFRSVAKSAASMEAAAKILIRYMRDTFVAEDGEPNCVLVRCFKTHRLQQLPEGLKTRALEILSKAAANEDLPCLTLLASAGNLPAWNDVASSKGHAVIPLESVEAVERAPMIAQLVLQLGFDIEAVMYPSRDLILEADERTYNVFHVEHAVGSPSVPAQEDFVQKHGIQSVLGFGGLLPSGDLFAVIVFSRVRISRDAAHLFRTLALSVKVALLPFTRGPIFAGDPAPVLGTSMRRQEQDDLRSEAATLRRLIPALEAAALHQTSRLEDVIADLNEQKEHSQRLASRLGSMLESTTDAVFMLDRAWRFTYLNQNASRILQTDRELLGKDIWEEFPAAVHSSYWEQYHTAMDLRMPVQFHEHYPAPLNRWFEIHAFPSDTGIAVFFHDITDRRDAESALMRSEKLAAVGRLAASIAHEINNPLESVTNLLYLARRSTDPSEIRDYLSTADRELRRAGAITTQTLRFHKQSTNPTEVTFEELIDGVLSIHQGRIVNSRVNVERQLRPSRPVMCFDGEIRQVVSNLVGNAVDAMHPAGGRLVFRSREAVDWRTGRKGLHLTIADTGSGMTPEALAKATEPFFTTKGIGGTGLGLWISKEILERHAGRLFIRSSQQRSHSGTVAMVFLPFEAVVR